jgi:hypothetical protein
MVVADLRMIFKMPGADEESAPFSCVIASDPELAVGERGKLPIEWKNPFLSYSPLNGRLLCWEDHPPRNPAVLWRGNDINGHFRS